MLVGDLLCWGGCEAQSLVGVAGGTFHLFEPGFRLLNKHLLQRPVDTLCLSARMPNAVVLGRSVLSLISARRDGFPGLAGLSAVRPVLLHLRKTNPEQVLQTNASSGGASRIEAVAHVDVGAGRIDSRLTQDRQSKRCSPSRSGTSELADAADRQTAT